MAANAPDLISLLCLEPKFSKSPFGGNHRTLLIQRDYSNKGDFVFNNLLQHFGRREPNTQILVITLSHDWLHYSASATKCGFNLRKKQNMGNIQVLDLMSKFIDDMCEGKSPNSCDYILTEVKKFIESQGNSEQQASADPSKQPNFSTRPIIILIDDLSLLLNMGERHSDIYRMMTTIDRLMRESSFSLPPGRLSHLIIQTLCTNIKTNLTCHTPEDSDLNFLVSNLDNFCDISLTLKPLESGNSTKVDGTIKIMDNRLPAVGGVAKPTTPPTLSLFSASNAADVGSKKSYFYKLSDRRVRLTSNALIY